MTPRRNILFALLALTFLTVLPDAAFASGGLAEFAGPLEKILDTMQGPIMKVIMVFMVVIMAVSYWWQRQEEISGLMKNLMGVVLVISVAVFAGTLTAWLFPTVSGALI